MYVYALDPNNSVIKRLWCILFKRKKLFVVGLDILKVTLFNYFHFRGKFSRQ